MINYIYLMKSGAKFRVPLTDVKVINEEINSAMGSATPETKAISYNIIYSNGVIRINLLDLSAIYPETNEVN